MKFSCRSFKGFILCGILYLSGLMVCCGGTSDKKEESPHRDKDQKEESPHRDKDHKLDGNAEKNKRPEEEAEKLTRDQANKELQKLATPLLSAEQTRKLGSYRTLLVEYWKLRRRNKLTQADISMFEDTIVKPIETSDAVINNGTGDVRLKLYLRYRLKVLKLNLWEHLLAESSSTKAIAQRQAILGEIGSIRKTLPANLSPRGLRFAKITLLGISSAEYARNKDEKGYLKKKEGTPGRDGWVELDEQLRNLDPRKLKSSQSATWENSIEYTIILAEFMRARAVVDHKIVDRYRPSIPLIKYAVYLGKEKYPENPDPLLAVLLLELYYSFQQQAVKWPPSSRQNLT